MYYHNPREAWEKYPMEDIVRTGSYGDLITVDPGSTTIIIYLNHGGEPV
jgi:hypothetical protein